MRSVHHLDDEAIVVRSRRDPAAFGVLFDRHGEVLMAWLSARTSPECAADLVAETFAQAFAGRERYTVQGPGSVAAWLFGIARNQWRMHCRSQRIQAAALVRLAGRQDRHVPSAAECSDERLDARARLDDHRDAMSHREHEAVMLRVDDGLSFRQIADRIGCSEPAARMRVSRGLRFLRGRLG